MASSGNFCTMNAADTGAYQTVTGGNLIVGGSGSSTADQAKRGATFYIQSGKWYWEVRQTVGGSSYGEVGISVGSAGTGTPSANSGFSDGLMYQSIAGTLAATAAGYVGLGTVTTTSTGVSSISSNQVINIALDMDNRKLWFGLDGTYFNSGDPANGTNPQFSWTTDTFVTPTSKNYATNRPSHYNFGQDSTFGGNETAGGNADGNGHGDFHSSVPTGFLSLCSSNLPISDDINAAETDDDYPAKQFGADIFTGNGGTQTIQLGDSFKPDLVIMKNRGTANSWIVIDSTRGYNKTLKTDDNSAESTGAYVGYGIESDFFDSTGIKANGGGSPGFNASGGNYIVQGWRANGGTTSSNSEGNITSTVQANTKAGFSIITYTGSGGTVSGANPTFGHGLESAPDFLIFKCRSDGSTNWIVWHSGLGGANKYLSLNGYAAAGTDTAWLSNTAPSSTLITTDNGGWGAVNGSSRTYVCYAWHSVEGYSKFDSYVGNGNDNGTFIYTGFRPRMVFCKNIGASEAWVVADTARETENPVDKILKWNNGNSEATGSTYAIDIVSNGFKVRTSWEGWNQSGNTIVYGAWADVSFKFNNTF